ncbi:hypothetical protein BG015_004148 [Linnemannia schmuckeri]|uniref:Uncharacterized protein n=1 Tax=Linnemannia schmuckeri TaxID=64567 RepID=A0A9P5S7K8_9FUNG|nr:hypothetical protein BG015_004148 [Linnemannia schmuckeri]
MTYVELHENLEFESDDGDVYQEEQEVSTSPSPTANPTPSSSPASASASPSPLPVILHPRRVTRSSAPKDKKVEAATTPKTPETPRTSITRARVVKSQAAVVVRGDQSEGDIESVGNTKSEADLELFKTPTRKKPRPRTKRAASGGRKPPPVGGEVESERDVKPVKIPAPKKPRAKSKGRGAGDQSEGAAESEADAKPVKTPKPRRSRAETEGLGAAASGRAKTTATLKKSSASRPKKIMKEIAAAATTLMIASIQDNDDGGEPFVGLSSKVSYPLDYPMDGIEMYRSAAVLQTLNRDYEMMAMSQQERNGGEYQYRLLHDTMSRSSTVLTVAPTLDDTGKIGQGTVRTTHIKSVFSPTIKEGPRTSERVEPTVPVDRHLIRSSVLDEMSLFSLSVKAEPHVPEPLGSRSIISAPDSRLIHLQKPSSPITVSRSVDLKLDLSTMQPWEKTIVPMRTASKPSFLARIDNPPSAATTPSAATLLVPPETVDDVAMIVEKAYDDASQYLLGAMKFTKRALEDQANAIQFHAVALKAFGQGMTMTESQCHTLFPQEQFADLAVRSALFPLPRFQALSASTVTPLSVTLAPVAQSSITIQDESMLINVSPSRQSGNGSTRTRSSSYSSYLLSSRPLSPAPVFPPSMPSRSTMRVPIPIRRNIESAVPWLSSSDFANNSVQPPIFAHNQQGYAITTPLTRSSPSVQASEPLGAPYIATSFSAMMSAENQHNSLHALNEARRKALYDHFQRRRDEGATQSDARGQQRDLTPSQQQGSRLAMSTLAIFKVQPEYYNHQQHNRQHNQQHNHEVNMGHLKATTVIGEETRVKDEEAAPMRVQLTSSRWTSIKE